LTKLLRSHGRVALWLAWALPFLVYALSAYRTVGFWDTGEMDTVPWILGIAHSTGFPAYVLGGWIFAHVVPIGSVAYRMGLFGGLAMSLAAWLIAKTVNEEHDAPWIGAACAWMFAFGDIAWTRGTRAEVHALAMLSIAATIYLALRWYATGDARALIGGALAWAVGLATHPVAALIAPGLLLLLVARARTLRAKPLLAAVALCAVTTAAFYAYLPLRSAYVTAHAVDPTRALGLPPGRAFWDYDHPSTRAGFLNEVLGADFDAAGGVRSILSPDGYVARGPHFLQIFVDEFTPVGAALVIFGIVTGFGRNPIRSGALLLAAFASVPFALGFTQEADPDRYFLTAFLVGSIFAGDGAMWFAREATRYRWAVPSAIALIAAVLFFLNRGALAQPRDNRATGVVDRVLALTSPTGILVCSWVDATPLAYAAYVEHRTQGRTIDAAWIGDDAAYVPRWLRTRRVYLIGSIFGKVPGYRFETISADPAVYLVVPMDRPPAGRSKS